MPITPTDAGAVAAAAAATGVRRSYKSAPTTTEQTRDARQSNWRRSRAAAAKFVSFHTCTTAQVRVYVRRARRRHQIFAAAAAVMPIICGDKTRIGVAGHTFKIANIMPPPSSCCMIGRASSGVVHVSTSLCAPSERPSERARERTVRRAYDAPARFVSARFVPRARSANSLVRCLHLARTLRSNGTQIALTKCSPPDDDKASDNPSYHSSGRGHCWRGAIQTQSFVLPDSAARLGCGRRVRLVPRRPRSHSWPHTLAGGSARGFSRFSRAPGCPFIRLSLAGRLHKLPEGSAAAAEAKSARREKVCCLCSAGASGSNCLRLWRRKSAGPAPGASAHGARMQNEAVVCKKMGRITLFAARRFRRRSIGRRPQPDSRRAGRPASQSASGGAGNFERRAGGSYSSKTIDVIIIIVGAAKVARLCGRRAHFGPAG